VVVAKYGHTIVERNRLRRRLRELVRTALIPQFSGTDVVVRVFPSAYTVGFETLAAEVERVCSWLESDHPGA
jgi:ribonuclease P protein component